MTTEQKVNQVEPLKIHFDLQKRSDYIDKFQLTQTAEFDDKRYASKWMMFSEDDLSRLYQGLHAYFTGEKKPIIVPSTLETEELEK